MSTAFWFCAVVTLVSAFISLGFSLVALRSTGDTYIAALYAVSRSIALAAVSVAAIVWRREDFLLAVAAAMTIVQAIDAYVGTRQNDLMKTAGPIFLSVVNVIALIWLARG